jgi:hypothetical protein
MKKKGQKTQTIAPTATTVLPAVEKNNNNEKFVVRDVRNTADDADADDEEMNSGFYSYLRSTSGK